MPSPKTRDMTSTQTTTIKAEDKKKKTVFRQLLDSPYNITWYYFFLFSELSAGNQSTHRLVLPY